MLRMMAVRGAPQVTFPTSPREKLRGIRLPAGGGPVVPPRGAAVQKGLQRLHVDDLPGRQPFQRHADGRGVGLAEDGQAQMLSVAVLIGCLLSDSRKSSQNRG